MKVVEEEIDVEEELSNDDGQIEENNCVIDRKDSVSFPLSSGPFSVDFHWDNDYDRSCLEAYKKNENIMSGTKLIGAVGVIVLVIAFIVLIFSQNFVIFLVAIGITVVCSLIAATTYENAKQSNKYLMYDYVLYDLKRRGARITYSNRSTGTISYKINKVKTQISVFRGYNSHAY